MKLYAVKINLRDGTTWNVTGKQEVLQIDYDALIEALKAPDGCGERFVQFSGICDSAMRSPMDFVFAVEAIQAASFGPWE